MGRGYQEVRVKLILQKLRLKTASMIEPAGLTIVKNYGKKPFLVLVSCILSLRTKDNVSLPASISLFEHVMTPQQMVAIELQVLERLIYPVGFYRQKARQLKELSQMLIDIHGGIVPNTKEELLQLKGVGLKTANLVLAEGFDIPAICVDIHVHRISNRLGLVSTKTPEQTEQELKKILPKKNWIEWNRLLVTWGQNICVSVSPKCSQCVISAICLKVEVIKRR